MQSILKTTSLFVSVLLASAASAKPLVIAHRGASGYLPEHTLPAKALAHGMGVDYLEQDVVLTKDDHPIVLHDVSLNAVTDVARKFPKRARADKKFYAIDFTLEEIKTLRINERVNIETGKKVFPNRFAYKSSAFRIPTLKEELAFIQGLNQTTGKDTGVYVELKSPAWHQKQGKDITKAVYEVLKKFGYPAKDKRVFIQCFEDAPLIRLKNEFKTTIPLVQLIAENGWWESPVDYDKLKTPAGIKNIATYAVGIGPWIGQLYLGKKDGKPIISDLVASAKAQNLMIHPYTARADRLPKQIERIDELFDILFAKLNVDGVFTDHPDMALKYIDRSSRQGAK